MKVSVDVKVKIEIDVARLLLAVVALVKLYLMLT